MAANLATEDSATTLNRPTGKETGSAYYKMKEV
jgi:hypothetical protein